MRVRRRIPLQGSTKFNFGRRENLSRCLEAYMFRSIAAAHLERASPRVRQGLQRALPAHWSVRCPCAAPPDDAPPLETRPSSLRCDAPPPPLKHAPRVMTGC